MMGSVLVGLGATLAMVGAFAIHPGLGGIAMGVLAMIAGVMKIQIDVAAK